MPLPSDVSLADFVLNSAAFGSAPDRAILADSQGRTLTPLQLRRAVRAVAAGLHEDGVRKGDVVCLFAPNVLEYPIAIYAIATLGAVCTTCSPQYTADELARQLNDAGATYLITFSQFLEKAEAAVKAVGGAAAIKRVYVIGKSASSSDAKPFAQLLACTSAPPQVKIDPKTDLVALPYSSGTTGLSKGVALTHFNLVANISQYVGMERSVGPGDVFLATLPWFHIYGMVVVMHAGLYRGVKLVALPSFDLASYLRLTQEHRVTVAHIVPPIALLLAKHPSVAQYDVSSLRAVFSGAAPLSREVEDQLRQRLPKVRIIQGYGMTEMSPLSHVCLLTDDAVPPGSCGQLVPNCEAKLVHLETGQPLRSYDDEGELCVRGPNIMQGYLNRPDATKETIDADGFLHTGDIAKVDREGYYFIIDRAKELIKYKGFQVPPAELEAKLLDHPAIADVAVVGIPDPYAGELPKAFVVKKADAGELRGKDVVEWLDRKVAPSKRLRGGVQFVETIPKSASGKILRRLVKQLHREDTSADGHHHHHHPFPGGTPAKL